MHVPTVAEAGPSDRSKRRSVWLPTGVSPRRVPPWWWRTGPELLTRSRAAITRGRLNKRTRQFDRYERRQHDLRPPWLLAVSKGSQARPLPRRRQGSLRSAVAEPPFRSRRPLRVLLLHASHFSFPAEHRTTESEPICQSGFEDLWRGSALGSRGWWKSLQSSPQNRLAGFMQGTRSDGTRTTARPGTFSCVCAQSYSLRPAR